MPAAKDARGHLSPLTRHAGISLYFGIGRAQLAGLRLFFDDAIDGAYYHFIL